MQQLFVVTSLLCIFSFNSLVFFLSFLFFCQAVLSSKQQCGCGSGPCCHTSDFPWSQSPRGQRNSTEAAPYQNNNLEMCQYTTISVEEGISCHCCAEALLLLSHHV